MFDFVKDSPLFAEARQARLRPRLFAQFLLFWIVAFVAETAAGIFSGFYAGMEIAKELFLAGKNVTTAELQQLMQEKMQALAGDETYILLTLFGMAALLVLIPVYCRYIEKRPLSSMGFRRGGLQKYGIGLLAGMLMAGAMFGLLLLTRSVTTGAGTFSTGKLLLFLLAFLIQGAAEEILMRGYFMVSLSNSSGPATAVICSSLFFSLMHAGNNGVGIIPFLNLFLFGMLANEVEELWKKGYHPSHYYQKNPRIKRLIDTLRQGVGGISFGEIADSLTTGRGGQPDSYMVLADFDSYSSAQERVNATYLDKDTWNRMSLVNIAKAGFFAADRSVEEYAQRIWNLQKICH